MCKFEKSKNFKVVVVCQKVQQSVLAVYKLTESFPREAFLHHSLFTLIMFNREQLCLLIESGKLLNNYGAGKRRNLADVNFI